MKRCKNKSHGRVFWLRKANYCPICGDETVRLSFCPFKFYIAKSGLIFTAISCALVIIFLNVFPNIQGCSARLSEKWRIQEEKNVAIVESMPSAWQVIFQTIEGMQSTSYKHSIIEDYVNKNPSKVDYLTPKQFRLIMLEFSTSSSYQKDVHQMLSGYVKSD